MTASLDVTLVSHATLKISGSFGTLVCDPWILNEPVYNFSTWKFPAAVIPPAEVVRNVDYLFVSHSHEDHFHIPSVDLFSRDLTVLLPEYENHPGLRGYTVERVFRLLGFHNIRKLRPWQTIKLGGVTSFTLIPSAATRSHDWENAGFIIEHPDCTLLNMNDNLTDEALCDEIALRFPRIDIEFIQMGGVTMYPGCFRMAPEKMRSEAARRKVGYSDQRRAIERIRPARIAPFAADFGWLDDRYFHNNWANRGTPELFERFVRSSFEDRDLETIVLLPSDRWNMSTGITRQHAAINWPNYLDEIAAVKRRFQPKLDALNAWLLDVDFGDLKGRSMVHCQRVQRWITRDYIDFSARFRQVVEGPNSNFSFVLKADPASGFKIDWHDDAPVDQTLYVAESTWAAVLEGKQTWNIIQWVAEAEQTNYRPDMGRFWFWLEYHVDLNAKNVQAFLDPRLYPALKTLIRPQLGVFPMDGEWPKRSSRAA